MNTILKLPPYPCTSIALSIFSDCCSSITSCSSHSRLHLCYKPNLLKNGLPKSRLHSIGCTKFDKNSANYSPTENHATEKHQRGLENLEDRDRRHQVSRDDANLVDFVNGSGQNANLTNLSDSNNGKFAENVNLGDFSDTVTANYDSSVGNVVYPMSGNGSDRFKGMDKRNPLGESILDENSANLVCFSDKCDSSIENEMDGRYENGFDRSNRMDKRNQLSSCILDEINVNLVDSRDKVGEKCDFAVGKDGDILRIKGLENMVEGDSVIGEEYGFKQGRMSTNKTNVSKEKSDNVVIRKVWSPFSSDPIKAKKDKGQLDDEELQKLKILENFVYCHSFDHGHLMVKLMGTEHMEDAKELLTESFAELMWGPLTYRPLLKFTITEHIMERRSFLPHAATLVGLYAEREGEWILAGTVELSFNAKGAAESPPSPTPPKRSPYLCNMAVNKSLRRRGIGRQLLKASEKLVPQMGSNEICLHCRIIDTAPYNMYTKAGYKVVQTDNIFALLTLQRRRHLMYKKLPLPS